MNKVLLIVGLGLSVQPIVGNADIFADLEACKYSCSSACASLSTQLDRAIAAYRQSCSVAQPPPSSSRVSLYYSDSCERDLIGNISETTDCTVLARTSSNPVWGVKVGATCLNIRDTNILSACLVYQAAAAPESQITRIYYSDSCAAGDLIGYVSPRSDCAVLKGVVTNPAWGIKGPDGVCQNISDTDFYTACIRYKDL